MYEDLQNMLSQRCSLLSLYPSTDRGDENLRRRRGEEREREWDVDAELGGLRRN